MRTGFYGVGGRRNDHISMTGRKIVVSRIRRITGGVYWDLPNFAKWQRFRRFRGFRRHRNETE